MAKSPSPRYGGEFEREEVEAELRYDNVTPEPLQPSTSSSTPITRTVAIIKTHALSHRFDIEKRIQEASFEIVKERQMEFDTETDPETLYELFGEDADSLAEGPVWVYVLERRRAVEVWNTLMGDRDTEVALHETPNSLRALYGLSLHQNGVMGSPDNQTAEIQIASLFASSPPFPTVELPQEDGKFDSLRSVTSSMLESIRRAVAEDEGYAPSSTTNPSTLGGSSPGRLNANGKALFKARLIPATHDKPDIVPRTTRAAALRAGQPVEKTVNTPRVPVSKERHSQMFANIPGHKRSSTIAVASTAAPTIAPRMTRSASLRLGQAPPPPVIRKRALTNEEYTKHGPASTFEGVPGHKRRESIAVASVKAPIVAPRLNKSAALRAQKEQVPPSSFMFKTATTPATPSLPRVPSRSSLGPPKPVVQRPASQAALNAPPSRYAVGRRASSVIAVRPPPNLTNGTAPTPPLSTTTSAPTVIAKPNKPRPSSLAPSIAPRTNKSAALRQAKKEAENAAAAAAAARKAAPKANKGPPSSFKAIPA